MVLLFGSLLRLLFLLRRVVRNLLEELPVSALLRILPVGMLGSRVISSFSMYDVEELQGPHCGGLQEAKCEQVKKITITHEE
jgi:hypothetical protein